jgi:hypothetical protein
MNPARLDLLFLGLGFVVFALVNLKAIFVPAARWHWGKRGNGKRLSPLSHCGWFVTVSVVAIAILMEAYGNPWPNHLIGGALCCLLLCLLGCGWRDNRSIESESG